MRQNLERHQSYHVDMPNVVATGMARMARQLDGSIYFIPGQEIICAVCGS